MMEEIWKDIEGYQGIYQVSNLGRVKSLYRQFLEPSGRKHTCPEKILKQTLNMHGYFKVDLYKNRKHKVKTIHGLVATYFVKKSDDKKNEINHINKIRTDNRIENLEWVTSRDNIIHSLLQTKKTSQFTGVYKARPLSKGHKKLWNSAIRINNKRKNLGNFYTELEARNAYQQALMKYGIQTKYAI